MIASRKALLGNLKAVAPAVADNELYSELVCFCFTGREIVTYNGKIALSIPRASDFTGCIPARPLIEILEASNSAAVEIRAITREVEVRMLWHRPGETAREIRLAALVTFGDTGLTLPMFQPTNS